MLGCHVIQVSHIQSCDLFLWRIASVSIWSISMYTTDNDHYCVDDILKVNIYNLYIIDIKYKTLG